MFRLGVFPNFAPHTPAIVVGDIYFVKRISQSFREYKLKFGKVKLYTQATSAYG